MVSAEPLASSLRVRIDHPSESDRAGLLAATQASTELHDRWVSPPRDDDGFDHFLARTAADTAESHLARALDDQRIVGVITINNIVRSSFLNGQLGWYAVADGEGRGLMTEALDLVVARAFGQLGLHRLEANIQPANRASIALASRLGFRHEGLSSRYLYVDGAWRDHERFALTIEDRGQSAGRASSTRLIS